MKITKTRSKIGMFFYIMISAAGIIGALIQYLLVGKFLNIPFFAKDILLVWVEKTVNLTTLFQYKVTTAFGSN